MSSLLARALPALVLLLAAVSAGAADEVEQSRKRLGDLRQRIEAAGRELTGMKSTERDLLGDLETLNAELALLGERQRHLTGRLATVSAELADKREAARVAEQAVESLRTQVERRLVALYKSGSGGVLRALFSSGGPLEMERQHAAFKRVIRHDRELLQEYRLRGQRLTQATAALAEARARQEGLLSEAQRQRETLAEAERLKQRLLANLKQDQRALTAQLAELKERERRLTELLKGLESRPSGEYNEADSSLARQRGRIPWPAEGPVRVGFGTQRHPELGTLVESKGIEIGVPPETPMKAVGSGRVVFASLFKGYGNLVIVDHGASFHSLYAHAGRLARKVGEAVQPGDVLGYSGYPGTEGIYLEFRQRGVPLDPLLWLAKPAPKR